MFKKYAVILTAVCLLLTACSKGGAGSGTTAEEGKSGDTQATGDKKTVVMAVMSSNRFLEEEVQKFEQAHPDIHVELKEYMALPNTGTGANGKKSVAINDGDVEKYVQSVTTQVLSGHASDLIVMDVLPVDKFVKQNALANLYDIMNKDTSFDKKHYYQNIFKSLQNGEGLYAVPISFTPVLVKGNLKLLHQAEIVVDDKTWTWGQFKDIAKKLKARVGQDYYAFLAQSPNYLLDGYLNSYYSQGKANFDSESFRDLMRQIKSLYDEKALGSGFPSDNNKTLFEEASMDSPVDALVSVFNPDNSFYNSPSAAGTTNGLAYRPYLKLGINNKSNVKQEAWMFVKFLLSEEVQVSQELRGFPVSKTAVSKLLQQGREQLEQAGRNNGPKTSDGTGTKKIPPLSFPLPDAKTMDARIELLQIMLENVGFNQLGDANVEKLVLNEFESFISGQKTAEEVSKLIQNRVTTYLNE